MAEARDALLTVRGIAKRFPGVQALDDDDDDDEYEPVVTEDDVL